MIQLTVLYGHPQDLAAFDRYYREVHAPLAKQIPGLKRFTTTKPTSLAPQEPSPSYLRACFVVKEALQASLLKPVVKATKRKGGRVLPRPPSSREAFV